MLEWLQSRYQDARARLVKKHCTNIVAQQLMLTHAQELSAVPANEWAPIRERHAHEIAAVRDGNVSLNTLGSVDRRSWQFPYLPSAISRIRQPIVKMVPYNVRRFAKSSIARRAINLIKNSILQLDWDILPMKGDLASAESETLERREYAKNCFQKPNGQDSYQSFMEMGIDDMLTFGTFVVEPQITPDPRRPMKMWVVDSSTIRIFPTWRESEPDELHYAQMTGLRGERGMIAFYDDELMYLRDNPSVETPFGLGKMEVAFQNVNALLGVQEMSSRAGSDQSHRTWLWWAAAPGPQQIEIIRRHLSNDIEGQAKVNLSTGIPKPEVLEIQPVTPEDLLLEWQEMLIRMIANAFDMSAMSLNLERDINRSTGEVLDDRDFRSAVVPIAMKLADGFTRFLLHKKLGWTDLKFEYLNLDDPDTLTKMQIQSQLYSCNATTPNRINKAMGMPPLSSAWADLTQMETIVANEQVMTEMQDANAEKAFGRNQQAQQQMMEQYQQQGGENDEENEQAAAAVTVRPPKVPTLKPPMTAKPPSLRPPMMPKLPTIGGPKKMTAAQIATMKPHQFRAAQKLGQVPDKASDVKQQISKDQSAGILLNMNKELREYLDALEKEQSKKTQIEDPKPTSEDIKVQRALYKKSQHKQSLIEKAVYNVGKDGLPKTRVDQAAYQRDAGSGLGKEIPRSGGTKENDVFKKARSTKRRRNGRA